MLILRRELPLGLVAVLMVEQTSEQMSVLKETRAGKMHKCTDRYRGFLRRDRPTYLISLLASLCSKSVYLYFSSAAALIV